MSALTRLAEANSKLDFEQRTHAKTLKLLNEAESELERFKEGAEYLEGLDSRFC